MIELLSPVGDFETLKAAVQNGADSVYFGANIFSARAFAKNFTLEELQKAIEYAKIRGVKTHLTLNTLIKDDEFEDAFNLAKNAYKFGIDAIIVQDLGLAMELISKFPDLPIHGSTQMTIHNLNGALELQNLGFKRVVLSRELNLDEIEHICKNTNIEIECFAHGALCISYSGQCLFSSMLGGRSGNRGCCAQPCRLPYQLLENNKKIDSGYLLSTRDLCSLEFIPQFIGCGVTSLKIEGRMKSPQYVATVTRIYRKYIDLAQSSKDYIIDGNDKKELMQVFNRGMFSTGHLSNTANKNLVFKDKPNNMGIFLGTVKKYNKNKGLITLDLQESVSIGDTVAIENEQGSYTISELMKNNENIKETKIGQTVTIGRMKGNISVNDNIYKISSKALNAQVQKSLNSENRKVFLNCKVTVKKGQPLMITVTSANKLSLYKDLNICVTIDESPIDALNRPLDKMAVANQISKTSSTIYEFKYIDIELDDNVFLPKISSLNSLRRKALEEVENYAISRCGRKDFTLDTNFDFLKNKTQIPVATHQRKISLLLNNLNLDFDYSKLEGARNIYIPLKFFTNKKYADILNVLNSKFKLYIYLPNVIRVNYKNLFYAYAKKSVEDYDIRGFVISNIGNLKLLRDLFKDLNKHFRIISNYTLNVFNSATVLELKKIGVNRFTISPELDNESIKKLCNNKYLKSELIVYGRTPLVTMNYCLLGNTNKCYPECSAKCTSNSMYYLKDRFNTKFPIMPDNVQTVTTLFNNKITSISPKNFDVNSIRIDILNENIEEINKILAYYLNL